nr:hypothetical protein [Tanacetum cinerariifolium]
MAFGSQTAGDAVVPKFDMHVYTSVLTSDEVNSLVSEYAIPLALHPCVPHSNLTTNRLPADKIGPFFLIDRRSIPDAMPWRHQDSNVADSAPTGLDLRPYGSMWGYNPVFKDGEGTVPTSMSQFLKFPMAGGVRVGKGTALTANKAIPQHTTPPLPSGTQIPEKSYHQNVSDEILETPVTPRNTYRKVFRRSSRPCPGYFRGDAKVLCWKHNGSRKPIYDLAVNVVVSDEILETPITPSEHLLESLPEILLTMSQVRFIFLSFILFTYPFSLHHMAFGSQTAGDVVVSKFDMHVYTSVLTSDEVNSLVAEYAIPLDLHPCVPPSDLTMNRLPADKIGIYDQYLELSGVRVPFSTLLPSVIKHFRVHISQLVPLGLNRLTMFEIYCRSLEIDSSVNLFRAFYKLNKLLQTSFGEGRSRQDFLRVLHESEALEGSFFSYRPSHYSRCYALEASGFQRGRFGSYRLGLTTIWKHVGHHSVFKDGEGTGNVIVLSLLVHIVQPLCFVLTLLLLSLLQTLPVCPSFSSSRWPEVFVLAKERLLLPTKPFLNILLRPCLSTLRFLRSLITKGLLNMRMRKGYFGCLSVFKVSLSQMEPAVSDEILETPVAPLEHLPESLSEILPTMSRIEHMGVGLDGMPLVVDLLLVRNQEAVARGRNRPHKGHVRPPVADDEDNFENLELLADVAIAFEDGGLALTS